MRHFQGVVDRLGVIQIDSVNVLARAHLLPVYSRLGDYDVALFDRAAKCRPPRLVEFWAHEAALVPPSTYALLAGRRRRYADPTHFWGSWLAEHRGVADDVLSLLTERPMTARQIHQVLGHAPAAKRHWGGNWTYAKRAAESLFATGELAVTQRNGHFERIYDLPERLCLPPDTGLPSASAVDELVRLAARAQGIGTAQCFGDYFRLPIADTRAAVSRLVDSGELLPVEVRGWPREVFLYPEAARPRRVRARALLAPFDPLVWERRRMLELFGMHYRISIYTPAAKREHGYYVLPFLLGEDLVGRVDLKADHQGSRLLVRTAFAEPDAPSNTARELAAELEVVANWLGLGGISLVNEPRGDLVPALAREL